MANIAQPPPEYNWLRTCQDRPTELSHDLSENNVLDPILTDFRL